MQNAVAKLPEIYFDAGGKGYWLSLPSRRFLCLEKKDVGVHLIHAGLDTSQQSGPLGVLDRAFLISRLERAVDYAGPLAGHRIGPFVTSSGNRILVTSEAREEVFKPAAQCKKMEAPRLEQFLHELFGPEQVGSVLLWLKLARQSLMTGDFRPGQMLVLAGPSNCGKSLFQALVTEILGGRSGKPYRYMIGETSFNADLASSEHLMIEDENASVDIRARRKFGAAIKEFTVCTELSVHAKGRQAITLPTFKRITLSVNDEPENLMILPPMDSSLLDKIMLFKCGKAELSENRVENWQRFTSEIPAFCALLKTLRVPKNLACPRFGVLAYHNADLLELLHAVAPETRLLNLIDEIINWKKEGEDWRGTAEELERQLRSSAFSFAVEKLLYFSSACGTYLGRLAMRYPNRFECRKVKGKTVWIVRQP